MSTESSLESEPLGFYGRSGGRFTARIPADAPLEKPRKTWRFSVTLANLGVYTAWFGPIQVLLGLQAAAIAPDHKEYVLSLVTGVGAFVSAIGNPVFGALSDRTTSRFGRRLPWVFWGTAIGALGLVGLAFAGSVWAMVVAWALVQASLNAMYAAITATINDQVKIEYRGQMGGWLGIGQTVGVVAGTGVAAAVSGITAGYLVCAALLVAFVLPYLFTSRDRFLRRKPGDFHLLAFLQRFWVSPKKYPDFAWTWASRFLINLSNALCTLYLLFYLMDAVKYQDAEIGVFILSGLYALFTVASTLLAGMASDRMGQRKPLVIASGIVMAISAAVLAGLQTWPGAIVGAILLGIGYGIYVSVDFALTTQVLPPTNDAARDLGVINIAAALPQALAPVLAAPLVKAFADYTAGYAALYVFAAVVAVLGALLVTRVKSVR
ncbi:MAG: MFS transporter [Mobiluncus sp.]|uniref:MFS transporter n=1 Tax=Mobiluncus sp. TaxID=47293 RepID=UPI0025843816|nr:MFS transporter [Mobiluncus sp.]MCI6584015.1 MFS transporter [Mobiluncus sp.]